MEFSVTAVALVVLVAVVLVFGFIKKSSARSKPRKKEYGDKNVKAYSKNYGYHVGNCEKSLVATLEEAFDFIDAYISVDPAYHTVNMWISSPPCEKTDCSTDTNWSYDYFLDVRIWVSNWYDSIMNNHKDVLDRMSYGYKFDSESRTFTNRIKIASSANCFIKREVINSKIAEWVSAFEKENSKRKLTRTDQGAFSYKSSKSK